ncbi:MAG: hypothetical protein C5B49_08115, partial [Bdellovibrio sp.]
MSRNFQVDESIPPCQDFYKHVCSKVEAAFQLPADRSEWIFAFYDSRERLLCAKKKYFRLLTEGYEPHTPRAKPLKDFYLACMNEKASAAEERQMVSEKTKEIQALADGAAVADYAQKHIDAADGAILSFFTDADLDNPAQFDAGIVADLRTLPEKSYYENKLVTDDYQVLAADFFKALQLDNPDKRARDLIDLEKKISQLYPIPADFRKRWTERRYLDRKEWTKKYSHLRLERFLSRVPNNTRLRDLVPETLD